MNPLTIRRAALFVSLMATIAAGADKTYQQGTVTRNTGKNVSYELKGPGVHKWISNCADFRTGQTVDYRVEGDKVYIRRENGKEYKCGVEATVVDAPVLAPPTYQKGTIMGWSVRRDIHVGGGGTQPESVRQSTRKAKVYQLRGTDLVYQVDYCGAFQAGQFTVGQVVDYRVDRERLYIRHDNDKEYSCQIEGTWAAEGAKPDALSAAPAAAPPANP